MSAAVLHSARRVAVAVLLALALAESAFACSCGPWPSVEDSKAASQSVFTGIPIAIVDLEGPGDTRRITFQVTAVWKGAVIPQDSVLSGDPAMCGVSFTLGEEWLVYAFPFDASEVYAHICSRTARSTGNTDIAALGPPLSTPALAGSWGRIKARYR